MAHRIFLDANVLFSAAYRSNAGILRLWNLPNTELVTSSFALEEARRNLPTTEQRERLDLLLNEIEVGEASMLHPERRGGIDLPEKDWPILGGAVACGATHLITGDLSHFGPYFGQEVLGVRVETPADYLKSRD